MIVCGMLLLTYSMRFVYPPCLDFSSLWDCIVFMIT